MTEEPRPGCCVVDITELVEVRRYALWREEPLPEPRNALLDEVARTYAESYEVIIPRYD